MSGIFTCAIDLFVKHLKQNIVLILQIIITASIFLGFIGRLQFIYSTFDITNTFNDYSAYYFFPYGFTSNDDNANNIISRNGVTGLEVGSIYHIIGQVDEKQVNILGYDDTIIEYANLNLSDGNWFDTYSNTELIPIISIGDSYKVNDNLLFTDINGDTKESVVIGTISYNDYIMTFSSGADSSVSDLSFFVSHPDVDFIVPFKSEKVHSFTEDLDIGVNYDLSAKVYGQIIIPKHTIDDNAINNLFSDYGNIVNVNKMAENYKQNNLFDFIINGIILIVFTILTATGLGGLNGIQSRLNKRNYIIYYMLGMKKSECVVTEILRLLFVIISSFIIVILLYILTPINEIIISTTSTVNWFTFLCTFLFLLIICFVSSIGYVIKLGNGSLIMHYKN